MPRRAISITDATLLAAWTVGLADGDGAVNERLRLAAAQLSGALQRVEPNLRVSHAIEWPLGKRWIDLDARGRAMICAALFGSMGRTDVPDKLRELASDDDLREGMTWASASAGAAARRWQPRLAVDQCAAAQEEEPLLRLDESRAALATYPATREFEMLADWLDLKPKIKIGSFDFSGFDEEEEEEDE